MIYWSKNLPIFTAKITERESYGWFSLLLFSHVAQISLTRRCYDRSNSIFAIMEFNFIAYITWAFVTECTCNQVKFEISLTFSEHKFAFPDFYLPSSLCGTAGTGWIWPPHNKRLKVNILRFENSKSFSKFEKNWKNRITAGNFCEKGILGLNRRFIERIYET